MQKFFSMGVIAVITLGFLLTGCDKSSNSNSGISQPPASGEWKVTYFFDKGDETSYYSGYTFEFKDGGVLVATKGASTWTGTWSDNCDDSSSKFCIGFSGGVPSPLEEISEDWRVIEITDSFMHFEHTSGGNGDTDILHFEK